MSDSRLRVALIVGGFPDREHPISNVFTLRSAQALSREVDLRVVVLRAWLPRRKVRSETTFGGLRVTTIAVPQVPQLMAANVVLYQRLGGPLVKPLLSEVDLVHSGDAATIGPIVGAWAHAAGKAHVAQITQTMNQQTVPHLWRFPLRRWWERVDAVACNSLALARDAQEHWPMLPNINTVYRGVDLQLFHPGWCAFDRLDPGASGVRFVYLGGFPAYRSLPHGANTKGGYTILRAWKAAEDHLHAAGATLVVAGPACDRPDVATWQGTLRHPDAVRVVGPVAGEAIPALLHSSHALLVPSLQEGLPNVALEASATGRPVIGSDIPAIREVVEHGRTGILVAPGASEEWSAALMTYARDMTALQSLGRAARQRMEQHFDQRRYADQMLTVYEAAMAHRGIE